MLKKVTAIMLVMLFGMEAQVFAISENKTSKINENPGYEGKICFGEEIMKDALKESLEAVSKHLINKYLNNVNNVNISKPAETQNSTTNSTVQPPANTPVATPAATAVNAASTTTSASSSTSTSREEEVTIVD